MKGNVWCAKVFVAALGVLTGCSTSEPAGCAPENEIRGVCAGVPPAAVCATDPCTTGVACTATTLVTSDAELQTAVAGAMSGACIAVAPGTYGDVTLPGGVSLLGRSASEVTVGDVTVDPGQGAVLRGIGASSIHVVKGATGAKIVSVHVSGSASTGVLVDPQSSVALTTSTIDGSGIYGVYAEDAVDVSLDQVVIAGSSAPGLWVASSSTCPDSTTQPTLEVTSSILRQNHIAGVALSGVKATIQSLDVLSTVPGVGMYYGLGGGGISVASCSDVTAYGLSVHDNSSYGVLVDGSFGTIGGTGPNEDVEITHNVIGLSIQNITNPAGFKLDTATLDQNQGVGIGIRGESQSIIICRSGVTNTASVTLPSMGAGAMNVGDGLVWTDASSATIDDLALSGNALASVLIDGEASGTLSVTQSGGDQSLGIVQQDFTSGGMQPMVTGGMLQVFPTAKLPVPVALVPASL